MSPISIPFGSGNGTPSGGMLGDDRWSKELIMIA